MNSPSKLKNIIIHSFIVCSLIAISACSSPEDKANDFYENGMQLLEKGELVKANVEFRNALQLNRNLTKAIWGQVLVSEKQGNPRQQYKLLNTVLLNDPDHLEALVKLGRLLLLANQLDKALEKSDLSMKINDKDLSVLSLRAAVMLKLDNAPAAVKLAKQVLTQDPYYIDALMILATERLTAGNAEKAVEYLEQGIKKHKKNIGLQLIKIKALEKLEKNDLVEESFKQLIDFYPKQNSFNMALAQFYLKHGRKDEAEKIYRRVVENNPASLKAKIKLVQFISSVKGADAGLKQLLVFSQNNPDDYDLKFALVQLYISRKDISLASELLEKIINDNADVEIAVKAKGIMASTLLANGDKTSAEKIINDILITDKQNHTGLILKASIDIDRQKYDEAIGALRLVLRDSPNSSRALFFLARAHNLSGSPELADEQYLKAFKASKFNTTYGLNYAQFLLKRKQPNRAEKILLNTLSKGRGSLPVLKLLAQIRVSTGDWVGAQQIADAIKRSGSNALVADQIKGAILVGKKEYSESIALLKGSYQSLPDSMQPIIALVKAYISSGKVKEAEDFLDTVIKANPENINARILRGQVYSTQGQSENAISTFLDVIKREPNNSSAYYQLAIVYMREKNNDKAHETLKKALTISPENFILRLTQASLYERTGKKDEAIKSYEKLITIRPDVDIVANNLASLLTENRTDKKSFNKAYELSKRFKRSEVPQFKDTFAWASYRVGKYSDATALLKSVIQQSPNIPDFHYHLGMTYLAKDNKAMAREELEKALELAKDQPFAKEKEVRATLEKI